MGISPHEYLVRYRLKHAQKLLLNPEEGRSLADVAAACGFADQAHLGTAATQTRILSELPAKGIDGLAISPVDPSNQTLKLNDVPKQALLFTMHSDAPDSSRMCYVGIDNVAAGRQTGELVKQALPKGGKIMVFVGTLDAQNSRERSSGLKEVLQGSNVQVIDCRTDDTDWVRAKANVLDTMVKYPDMAALVGLWGYNGPAILNAVKDSKKVGAVQIVCFDDEEETLQGVRDGGIFATVVQQPYDFGYRSITLMNKYLNGDKSVIPAHKKVVASTVGITKDKVEEYAANLKKLRGH